ncbi:MAG: restriction endonuclease subunit S [Prevotella sp.]|jgi:type I restriction enzyme S subunit|nr:restriction endonuclease subunit S [Prevotella sp.]MCH4100946.1 restriction endonuclease subunit S [Prevotella sp.]MCI1595330.1 restriction endonuclease subunit S [Prevotella sp.]
MEEWKEYKLGDVATLIIAKADISLFNRKNYISTENILPNRSGIKEASSLPATGKVTAFCDNDILISNIRPYFKKIWLASFDGGCSNDVICLRAKKNVLCQFLYYLLSQDDFFDYIMLGAKGTKMPRGDRKQIINWGIALPPLKEQQKIVSILSSLDNKIALNRKINSNLEEQAKALFKSWFIDFEPFKGGKFVDSELGMIPEGWKVGRYDDIIEGTIAGDWGKEKSVGNYLHEVTCIRGCDFQDIKNGLRGNAPTRFILEKNFKNKRFVSHDILVEISGGTQAVSTGRVCSISQKLIDTYNGNVVCTNFCRVVRPAEGYSAFAYYSWLYKYDQKVMFGYENGTSGIKNFRLNDFLSMEPLIIPPKNIVIEFQNFIDGINSQMQTRGGESSKLENIRDSLLPKLMSGEIEVK